MEEIAQRGVWVPIEIKKDEKRELTSGLVNSGYRVEGPYIALPAGLCKKLGIVPREPEPYESSLWVTNETLFVRIVTKDKTSKWVEANVHTYMFRQYIIISAQLADKLGIGIYKPYEGLWFFLDEGIEKIRKPANPKQYSLEF